MLIFSLGVLPCKTPGIYYSRHPCRQGVYLMLVNGCDCSIVVKTARREMDIPYSDETLRETVEIMQEEASIEGDGVCRGLRKSGGVIGCVVTSLTIGTAPLLLYLAMGTAGSPIFISETKNVFKYLLVNSPLEDTENFSIIQDRKNERLFFEYCRVLGFELRIMRDEAIKLKLDLVGEYPTRVYPYNDSFEREQGERFNGDNVDYRINGKDYKNIYGLTLVSNKRGGTRTEIWIKRSLQWGTEILSDIEEIIITANLLKDKYEYRHLGTFRITIKRLFLISDETEVNATGAVISPLRFYVCGGVQAEVFASGEESIP
jgi:hypothetical protein